MRQPEQAEFLRHVANHDMIVALDSGLHRHLSFKQQGTFNRHFYITTWPGYLAISGDMSTFVFSRVPDMFEFFRGDNINPQYWSEKLQADDPHSGHKEFSEEFYRDAILRDFAEWDLTPARRVQALAEIRRELLTDIIREEAIAKAMDYVCPYTKNRFIDFWDHRFEDYTYHFIWCCRAIQWAIAQYDRAKTTVEAA